MKSLSKTEIQKQIAKRVFEETYETNIKMCKLIKNEILRAIREYTCYEESLCSVKYLFNENGTQKVVVECVVQDFISE